MMTVHSFGVYKKQAHRTVEWEKIENSKVKCRENRFVLFFLSDLYWFDFDSWKV